MSPRPPHAPAAHAPAAAVSPHTTPMTKLLRNGISFVSALSVASCALESEASLAVRCEDGDILPIWIGDHAHELKPAYYPRGSDPHTTNRTLSATPAASLHAWLSLSDAKLLWFPQTAVSHQDGKPTRCKQGAVLLANQATDQCPSHAVRALYRTTHIP